MTEQTDRKIIFITELIDQRLRKEKEIEYYEEQLKIIQLNMRNLELFQCHWQSMRKTRN